MSRLTDDVVRLMDYAMLVRFLGGDTRELLIARSRDGLHSFDDLARGIIGAGEKGSGDGYALGNTTSHSVLDIANAFGGPVEFIDGYAGRAESDNDPTKARAELGWQPTIDVMDYIADFVRHHPRPAR